MSDDILDGFLDAELASQWPASVASTIQKMESSNMPWDQIGFLLSSTPTSGVAVKGGSWKTDLWMSVKKEFRSFLCTNSSQYADLRSKWKGHKQKGAAFAVGALSGLIGGQLGTSAGVVAPVVVWLLLVGLRMGKNALCASLAEPIPPKMPDAVPETLPPTSSEAPKDAK